MKIAVFTGTRAEYGLLFWLLKDLKNDPYFDLKILVSGMHLSPEFGETYRQIETDGFEIDEKIEILLSSDSPIGVVKSMGLGVLGFADALNRINPELIVILGDRFEALAMAQAALILRIPIFHLHGGEITEGAYDDSLRHAITKLSYLHGVSTEEYRKRVIQMGEMPERVKNIGAIGLDHVSRSQLMGLEDLGKALDFELKNPYFLVTYHPVTLRDEPPERAFQELLDALDKFSEHQIILTYPNADDGGRRIISLIDEYSSKNPRRVKAITSLGQVRYLSAVKHADAVVGNSSSGIIEVPSFDVPTVNIGARQLGRLCAKSVLHVEPLAVEIVDIIQKAIDRKYKEEGEKIINPYGLGDASQQAIDMIKTSRYENFKKFYDMEH